VEVLPWEEAGLRGPAFMSICAPWNDRLAEPLSREHLVHVYRDDRALVEAVALYAGRGLGKGEAVILVATEPHLEAIDVRLGEAGFDRGDLRAWGQLITIEAAGLLSRFLVDGSVDAARFRTILADVITVARRGERFPRIRVYGEMVNLLWRWNHPATRQLEELWNEAIELHAVSLLCGYRIEEGETDSGFPRDLRALHSHLIPVEAAF
jgi:MEDS: MEthanogen/methylotroph, DcmR Sensory domain